MMKSHDTISTNSEAHKEWIMNDKPILVYPKKAQRILGIGTTKFYELNKLPNFPKAKRFLGKRPMYVTAELIEWALSSE